MRLSIPLSDSEKEYQSTILQILDGHNESLGNAATILRSIMIIGEYFLEINKVTSNRIQLPTKGVMTTRRIQVTLREEDPSEANIYKKFLNVTNVYGGKKQLAEDFLRSGVHCLNSALHNESLKKNLKEQFGTSIIELLLSDLKRVSKSTEPVLEDPFKELVEKKQILVADTLVDTTFVTDSNNSPVANKDDISNLTPQNEFKNLI